LLIILLTLVNMEVFPLGILSDAELVNVYHKALNYNLDLRFVELIIEELHRRGLVEVNIEDLVSLTLV
jgi:hypothetical protein